MRVFIAIDIDEAIRKALANLQSEILAKADIRKSDAKWVNPLTMHLTLKFLGEIKDKLLVEVCEIARDVATRRKSFDIDIGGVGHFGGKSARVLWVGAGQDSENLLQLQADLEQALASAGWPPETRKFAGHLTLCRVRNSRAGLKLANLAEEYKDLKLAVASVDSLCVYQSELRPEGPVYTVLGNYSLK
ncbi:MAG: RNA 2',3'-cyclic phosphodiesterase [Sedimentisphaerales bacterium]|nr:RNA 2',3'-cyclic phosphodiesterase [Sedimentisphaerales bacterium]